MYSSGNTISGRMFHSGVETPNSLIFLGADPPNSKLNTILGNTHSDIGDLDQGPNLMDLNCLPPVQIWIINSKTPLIFNFESVVQI